MKTDNTTPTTRNAANMTAHINSEKTTGVINIDLEGAVFGRDAEQLNSFLKGLAAQYKNVKWDLRLDGLEMLSMRALHVLKKFARIVRRRGCNVSMSGVQPHLQHTIHDLGLHKLLLPNSRMSQVQLTPAYSEMSV